MDLTRVLYSAETLDVLVRLVGTRPTRIHMDSSHFQFEYEGRCLVTVWDWKAAIPSAMYEELVYVIPRWYPDDVDSFPGFDGATVLASDVPIEATSVVRTLIWSNGLTTPAHPERVKAPIAHLVDVGFTASVSGHELACFAQGNHLFSRWEGDFVDDANRAALLERYQFVTLEEARRTLQA